MTLSSENAFFEKCTSYFLAIAFPYFFLPEPLFLVPFLVCFRSFLYIFASSIVDLNLDINFIEFWVTFGGPWGSLRWSLGTSEGFKMVSKICFLSKKAAQTENDSKMGRKWTQNGPKNDSKMFHGGPQGFPRGPDNMILTNLRDNSLCSIKYH